MNSAQNLDFQAINSAVLANPSYLEKRLPNAKRQGRELKAGDIHGAPGDSFSINTESGQWADFATSERGGDPVSFVAAQEGIGQGEAARLIADELGLSSPAPLPRKSKELQECPVDWNNPSHMFSYFYPDGSHAFDVLRWEKAGYRKAIRQSKGYDETGQRIRHNKGTELVPYNLVGVADRPAVLDSGFVVVVEGENKADALIGLGICSTCSPGGAGRWKAEYVAHFQGKAVAILPDNDKAGKDHAESVAASLASVAASVKVLNLPGLPDKGDILDWLEVPGNDVERLRALMNDAPSWRVDADKGAISLFSIGGFMNIKMKPREHLLYPVLPERGITMLFAPRGIGKTYLALSMAYAVACGAPLFGGQSGPKWFAARPRKVAYIDGEMAAVDLQSRLRSIIAGFGVMPSENNFMLLNPDLLPEDEIMPNLGTSSGQQWLGKHLGDVELLVIDNLSCLCSNGRENESESWLPVQKWLLSLKRRGISTLLVHHSGKSGEQRGTSAREDVLDCVLKLKSPNDFMPGEDGARFIIEQTKNRTLAGPDIRDLEASIYMDNDRLTWITKDVGDDLIQQAVMLSKEGVSTRKAAEELGIHHSKLRRLQERARQRGLL